MNNLSDKKFIFSIGAQKSGTTTLHSLLEQSQSISLPSLKETHFFSHDKIYKKGFDWYLGHFNFKKEIFCEVDPSYLFFEKASARIKKNIKSPKFIIIFRKPIDRALSHYFMSCYRGHENMSFIDALDAENNRLSNEINNFSYIHHSYLHRGNYSLQLEKYFKGFSYDNFLFIKFDDFISDKNKNILQKISNFININLTDFNLPKKNASKTIRSTIIRDLLYKDSIMTRAMKTIIKSDRMRNNLKIFINHFNSSNFSNSESKSLIEKQLDSIPEQYLHWNNKQCELLMEKTRLNLDDWMY